MYTRILPCYSHVVCKCCRVYGGRMCNTHRLDSNQGRDNITVLFFFYFWFPVEKSQKLKKTD